MKNPLILSVLALVLSAVAFATLLVRSSPSEPGATPPALPAARTTDGEVLDRMDALAEENEALRQRLSMLELRPAPAQRAPAGPELVSREEFDAFRDEVLEALGSRGGLARETSGESAVFKEQVASTLSEIRKEEAVGAAQRKLESRAASLDQTMPKIEGWLELTPRQSDEVRSALLAQYEREAELVRRWQAGEDPEVLGELKRSDREATRDVLARILSPTQLDTFMSRVGGGGKGGGGNAGRAGRGD